MENLLSTLIITIILLAVGIIGMGVKVFFTQKGQFPNTHIGRSNAMKERGIGCATSQDREAQNAKK